jgi:hypothetical protein
VFRAVAAVLTVCAIAAAIVLDRLPARHSPFAPLDLEQAPGFATSMKLARLDDSPEACRDAIERSELRATPLPDRSDGAFCGLRNAVAIERSHVPWSAPLSASCPLAAALYIWEREVVAPAAARHLGSAVVRIEHYGTYACRPVRGAGPLAAGGRPSQHATANAIDVSGFRLSDGRRITIARHWHGDAAEAAFLRDVRDGSCALFRAVLGPDYNAAHADHLHLDMGPWRICR